MNLLRTRGRRVGRVAALLLLLASGAVGAEPTPDDVRAAASAFAEGQRAQLRRDYPRAAELFEIADAAAPSPAALRSAIRNHRAAGHDARAATLALRGRERYPADRETRAFVDDVIGDLSPRLLRLRVVCTEPCSMTLDGRAVSSSVVAALEIFTSPGPHNLQASWADARGISRPVEGAAGATVEVEIAAPPKPVAVAEPETTPSEGEAPAVLASGDDTAPTAPMDDESGGLSPAFFWLGTAATVLAGGALVWSGLDTLGARDDYEADPTRDGYEDGVGLELRTNLLIGTVAVLGVTTAAIGLFATDWGGDERLSRAPEVPTARVAVGRDGAVLSVEGAF